MEPPPAPSVAANSAPPATDGSATAGPRLPFLVAVHCGAGAHAVSKEPEYRQAMSAACRAAAAVLSGGGPAEEAVAAAVRVMEDAPACNAGTGASLNLEGRVECDAGLMAGNGRFGGVGAVAGVRNPILAAAALAGDAGVPLSCGRVRPMLLVGEGARCYAAAVGLEAVPPHLPVPPEYQVTDGARRSWSRYRGMIRAADEDAALQQQGQRTSQSAGTQQHHERPAAARGAAATTGAVPAVSAVQAAAAAASPAAAGSPATADPAVAAGSSRPAAKRQRVEWRGPGAGSSCGAAGGGDAPHGLLRQQVEEGEGDGLAGEDAGEDGGGGEAGEGDEEAEDPGEAEEEMRLDTVGAVCVDHTGCVAAGVSSGGIAVKFPGRLGEAGVYGSGCWAQNPLVGCYCHSSRGGTSRSSRSRSGRDKGPEHQQGGPNAEAEINGTAGGAGEVARTLLASARQAASTLPPQPPRHLLPPLLLLPRSPQHAGSSSSTGQLCCECGQPLLLPGFAASVTGVGEAVVRADLARQCGWAVARGAAVVQAQAQKQERQEQQQQQQPWRQGQVDEGSVRAQLEEAAEGEEVAGEEGEEEDASCLDQDLEAVVRARVLAAQPPPAECGVLAARVELRSHPVAAAPTTAAATAVAASSDPLYRRGASVTAAPAGAAAAAERGGTGTGAEQRVGQQQGPGLGCVEVAVEVAALHCASSMGVAVLSHRDWLPGDRGRSAAGASTAAASGAAATMGGLEEGGPGTCGGRWAPSVGAAAGRAGGARSTSGLAGVGVEAHVALARMAWSVVW
ncbi:hypothetical protein HXX76_012626 [Chlamydomonas incerta]|uniref:Asparaginase n=1 Tax=Chlamydomonas incerta TaxID=51695 RepID=A0A835SV09_CHLIN|nr:hypothetical protein HXX76_012626 [Chlamydomonas incerta]|eukprot:KAG2427115.1 hypothetical protein HXX76_012626 [Chlamydomonas incerta]